MVKDYSFIYYIHTWRLNFSLQFFSLMNWKEHSYFSVYEKPSRGFNKWNRVEEQKKQFFLKIYANGQGLPSPPDVLVHEDDDSFGFGGNVHTILYNSAGEVSRNCSCQEVSSRWPPITVKKEWNNDALSMCFLPGKSHSYTATWLRSPSEPPLSSIPCTPVTCFLVQLALQSYASSDTLSLSHPKSRIPVSHAERPSLIHHNCLLNLYLSLVVVRQPYVIVAWNNFLNANIC